MNVLYIYLCGLCYNHFILTIYSVAPQRPLTGPLALNEKLSGISKLFEDKLKGPEGVLYHNNTLYLSLHYGHVVKVVDNQLIPVVKFGKLCGRYIYFLKLIIYFILYYNLFCIVL